MATSTLPSTREEIFRLGLRRAIGTVTYWRGEWGTITYETGPVSVEIFVAKDKFPEEEQDAVGEGSRVVFDMIGGQMDTKTAEMAPGEKRRKPYASKPALVNFNR